MPIDREELFGGFASVPQTISFRANALNKIVEGLWVPGTPGGSRRLPGGAEGIVRREIGRE
jgi:hypothetical protein